MTKYQVFNHQQSSASLTDPDFGLVKEYDIKSFCHINICVMVVSNDCSDVDFWP